MRSRTFRLASAALSRDDDVENDRMAFKATLDAENLTPPLIEMLEIFVFRDADPGMLPRFVNRAAGFRKIGVGKGTDGDYKEFRETTLLPIDCGTTVRTKMESKPISLIANTHKLC